MAIVAENLASGAEGGRAVGVPFVGCRSTGQVERAAPRRTQVRLHVTPSAAVRHLSLYQTYGAPAVLGPRGWHCLGITGSSGTTLLITPEPIDQTTLFGANDGITGFGIALTHLDSGASGRYLIAELIARVFPSYRNVAEIIAKDFDERPSWLSGKPYRYDELRYLSSSAVRYTTKPGKDGLGSRWLKSNDQQIKGVAVLRTPEREPDVLLLALRLPPGFESATADIIRAVERDTVAVKWAIPVSIALH